MLEQRSFDFAEPHLHLSATIPEIYDWHYDHNPRYPAFVYHDSLGDRTYVNYGSLVPAAHKAGYHVAKSLKVNVAAGREAYPTVAILSTADTVTNYTTLIGILRLGLSAFPISPRFSPSVIAHLLEKSNATAIFVSDPWLKNLASEAIEALKTSASAHQVTEILSLPQHADLYQENLLFERLPKTDDDHSAAALLVHTSCSTSQYPKVIKWTVGMNMQQAFGPVNGSGELARQVFGCPAIEPFHGIGLLLLFWMPSCGLIMGTFEPSTPAMIPTPDAVYSALRHLKPTFALVSTRFLEEWSIDPNKVEFLSTLKGILSGGKAIRKSAGDLLASEGVSLRNMYGSTESGHLSAVPSAHLGSDWEYFQLHEQCTVEFEPIGDGSFHAVVLSTPTHQPPVINATLNGCPAYATGDLFLPHPTRAGFWKFFGRRDAQIMLSTGLVVNPVYTEERICEHPEITSAVIFGLARPRLGVLLQLRTNHSWSSQDGIIIINAIWPHIEQINATAPKHFHIAKDMIIFAHRSKPFVYSQKGAPKRPLVLYEYQSAIDALYGSPAVDSLFSRRLVKD